jgi:hypothetical protein
MRPHIQLPQHYYSAPGKLVYQVLENGFANTTYPLDDDDMISWDDEVIDITKIKSLPCKAKSILSAMTPLVPFITCRELLWILYSFITDMAQHIKPCSDLFKKPRNPHIWMGKLASWCYDHGQTGLLSIDFFWAQYMPSTLRESSIREAVSTLVSLVIRLNKH